MLRANLMVGLLLLSVAACNNQQETPLPPGFSVVDGAVLQTQVVTRAAGKDTITPLPLTEDMRLFRVQLREIFAKNFAGCDRRSPELTLVLIHYPEIPKEAQQASKAKFGDNASMEFSVTTRCGPFCMEQMDGGEVGIFQIGQDGSSQLQASTKQGLRNIENLIDIFVGGLPDRLSMMFVGTNDPLAKRLQKKD